MMLGGFGTEHEIDAADEDGEGVGDVEQGGVEDGLSAEDGGGHGVADEADVAEHEHEAVHAAQGGGVDVEARQDAAGDEEDGVGEEPYAQQGQDEFAARKDIAHDGREDEAGAGEVDDESGELALKDLAHEAAFLGYKAHHDDEQHDEHLGYDIFHCFWYSPLFAGAKVTFFSQMANVFLHG